MFSTLNEIIPYYVGKNKGTITHALAECHKILCEFVEGKDHIKLGSLKIFLRR